MGKRYNIKGKDLCVFVRFGGANLKKQHGYTVAEPNTFHRPPAPRGIYCMPKVAQEFFLIGSLDSTQPGIMPMKPRHLAYPDKDATEDDWNAWRIKNDAYDWDLFNKRCKDARNATRKEFSKRAGNIWHHLEEHTTLSEIIERHGSWVKTTIAEWEKAFRKMSITSRYGTGDFSAKSIGDSRGIMGCYSMDHCEVFFDEKI